MFYIYTDVYGCVVGFVDHEKVHVRSSLDTGLRIDS